MFPTERSLLCCNKLINKIKDQTELYVDLPVLRVRIKFKVNRQPSINNPNKSSQKFGCGKSAKPV